MQNCAVFRVQCTIPARSGDQVVEDFVVSFSQVVCRRAFGLHIGSLGIPDFRIVSLGGTHLRSLELNDLESALDSFESVVTKIGSRKVAKAQRKALKSNKPGNGS